MPIGIRIKRYSRYYLTCALLALVTTSVFVADGHRRSALANFAIAALFLVIAFVESGRDGEARGAERVSASGQST